MTLNFAGMNPMRACNRRACARLLDHAPHDADHGDDQRSIMAKYGNGGWAKFSTGFSWFSREAGR
jgi:hypothetical protein